MVSSKASIFFNSVKTLAALKLGSNYQIYDEKISSVEPTWARISFMNKSIQKSINFCLYDNSDKIEMTIIDESDRNLDHETFIETNSEEGIQKLFSKI